MSGRGRGTISECVCAHRPQTTWKTAKALISTCPYLPHQVDTMINQADGDARSLLGTLKIRFKRAKLSSDFSLFLSMIQKQEGSLKPVS